MGGSCWTARTTPARSPGRCCATASVVYDRADRRRRTVLALALRGWPGRRARADELPAWPAAGSGPRGAGRRLRGMGLGWRAADRPQRPVRDAAAVLVVQRRRDRAVTLA